MSKVKQANIRAQFLSEGVLSASELASGLKVSQPTVSRLLQDFGPDLVRLGAGRSTRYALHREVEPGQSKWPLYRIDEQGEAQELGWLHALHGQREGLWYLEGAEDWPALKHGEFKDGIFEDLPWFLQDMRPQGYMGRKFSHWMASTYGYPLDPRFWNNDQVLWVFLHRGDYLPGAFLLGDSMLNDFVNRSYTPVDLLPIRHEFRNFIENDEPVGSSAGGEQPKASLTISNDDGKRRRVILLKFSPPLSAPTGQRWKDLLIAEHHAIATCSKLTGQPTETKILFDGDRCFLESVRFDRVSDWGRRAVVSLEAVDGAFLGMNGKPWTEAAAELRRQGLIGDEDVETISLFWYFGELIGNNDMHYGNLSFFLHPEFPMTVCPPYDVLPMLYAPTRNGEIVPRDFQPRRPLPRERELWQRAAEAAINYWEKLPDVAELSDEFKAIATENAKKVKAIAQKP